MRTPSKYNDLLDLIKEDYAKKKRSNHRYSLRAYGKFLGIDGSWLSKILSGKRPISPKLIPQFAQKLGLNEVQTKELQARASARQWVSETRSDKKWVVIPRDSFEPVDDWHHDVIIELMKFSDFQPTPQWVAKFLGISVPQAAARIERLKQAGLISIQTDGSWKDVSEGARSLITGINDTSASKRELQKKILNRSMQALESIPIESRDHSAIMVATHTSKITQAKFMLEKFRREFSDFLEDCPQKNAVYQLSLSLFPNVTEPEV